MLKDGVHESEELRKEQVNHVRKIAENQVEQVGNTTTLADPHVVEVIVKGRR